MTTAQAMQEVVKACRELRREIVSTLVAALYKFEKSPDEIIVACPTCRQEYFIRYNAQFVMNYLTCTAGCKNNFYLFQDAPGVFSVLSPIRFNKLYTLGIDENGNVAIALKEGELC